MIYRLYCNVILTNPFFTHSFGITFPLYKRFLYRDLFFFPSSISPKNVKLTDPSWIHFLRWISAFTLIFTTIRESTSLQSVMIRENASIESILSHLVDKVEIECDLSSVIVRGEKSGCSGISEENVTRTGRVVVKRSTESDSSEITCRICYDSSPRFPIMYPCRCKGTMGAIHLACLERWLEEGNRNSCELCGHEFVVERTPRYQALESIIIWICLSQREHQLFVRSFRVDLLRCVIVTPITIACSYVCVVAADFYSMNNYDNFPPARWTTYSLLAMMTLLVFSYFVWMYMAIQYHQRVWYYWWQKSSNVRVKLPTERDTSLTKSSNRRKTENISQV